MDNDDNGADPRLVILATFLAIVVAITYVAGPTGNPDHFRKTEASEGTLTPPS